MIVPSGAVRVLVATRPVDFRKGMDGLAALVRETLGSDPYSGVIYVFRAKRADRVKLLLWDGTGLVLVAKRLEKNSFRWPQISDGVMRLTSSQIDVADKTCACCGGLKHRIGEDVSERLDVIPAQFKVIVTRRPKYACQVCAGEVVQAPALERLIENGIPTETLVAHVLVAKYADHTPLYRQAQIYARQGITLDRSTLADWVGRAAFALRPVHARLLEQLKQSTKLFADETTAPVLDPGRGRVKKGQLWAYAADERPWAGRAPPGVAYVYAPDRKHARPAEHLAGFSGILQVDGYGAYAELAQRGDIALAFCWSHVRRQFYEIQVKTPAPIATEALVRIAALYAIEADIRGLAADERRQARQRRTKPLVDDLRLWLEAQLAAVSGKSTIAGAIRYALSRWEGLTRFLDDGRIEIDSNVVERSIRPIAMTESLCTPSSSICKH